MKTSQIARAVWNIPTSDHDYSQRPGQPPDLIIPDHYALWHTATLNFSVSTSSNAPTKPLRHLGWEVDETKRFSIKEDCVGIVRECFTAQHQAEKIIQARPDISYNLTPCSS